MVTQVADHATEGEATVISRAGRTPSSPSRKPRGRHGLSVRAWPKRYAARLFFSDLAIIVAVCGVFTLLQTNFGPSYVSWPGGPRISYVFFMTLLTAAWLFVLDILDTRDHRHVGQGITEYRRIVNATGMLFALVVIASFFLGANISRTMFVTVFPIGLGLLIVSRWLWRQWLRHQQKHGRYVHRAIVIGERVKVKHIAHTIRRSQGAGIDLVGAITASGEEKQIAKRLPVLGDYAHAAEQVDAEQADMLIIAGADDLDPESMRRLGWDMADRDVQLIVAPALTDVAGPRLHAQPVAGLPLIHVAFPSLEGAKRFGKRAFDIAGSSLLLLLSSPVLLAVTLAVRLDSRGPILYSQERIGRHGKPFRMLKFRSMVTGADDQLKTLLDAQGTSETPLFKINDDPRITRVGRFIRKYSLDEFPQLINVFKGEMSLVGPRPQRASEVALYDDAAYRRLMVKPGMSGLWQVSGRSSLTWEDTIRLDLYYVENWSFTQDIIILFRTVKAVVAPGASAH